MTKYKIVGIINLLLGILTLFISLNFLVFVIPKLTLLYKELNTSGNITANYIAVLTLLSFGIINLFLGIKNFSNTEKKDKYFKHGLIVAVITFFLAGYIVKTMVFNAIFPIYNATSP